MMTDNLGEIKRLPINEIAARLGIKVLRGNKAMCFGGHDKVTPSLSFWSAKNRWKCFGCGLGGGVIDLVMKVRQVDFKTALDWFAFEFGIGVRRNQRGSSYFKVDRSFRRLPTLPPQPLQSRGSSDSESGFRADPELYTWLLGKCGPVSECTGLDYLLSHAISRDAAAQFRVRELRKTMVAFRSLLEHWGAGRLFRSGLAFGLAGKPQRLIWPSYTLLFPFVQGDAVVYLQGRQFQREPKFLNLKSIPKPLYNQDRLFSLPLGSVIHICEGVPGALALESRGLPAVATLGASSFRAEWVERFLPYDIVLMPDGDRGGDTFQLTISKFFEARAKTVRVIRPLPGKDVADVAAAMRGTG